MATLFFTVWRTAEEVALGDPLQESTIDIAATTTQGVVITGDNRQRNRVRVMADANCFVTWGEDPTATDDGLSGRPMGSENPEYFDIEAGHKIAVITR